MSINRLINISVDYDFIFNKLDALVKSRIFPPLMGGYNSFLPLTLPHLWGEAGGGAKGRGT
jgi:hypothetical protein